MLTEYSSVVLLEDQPGTTLKAGDIGVDARAVPEAAE
jgi:hypothetical protein